MRVSDGVAVGGAWAEGGLEGNSEQALGKVGQLEVWGAGAARWGLARRSAGRGREGREMCGFGYRCATALSPFFFFSLFLISFLRERNRERTERNEKKFACSEPSFLKFLIIGFDLTTNKSLF